MTQFALSQATQTLINNALSAGGNDVLANVAAYTAISQEISQNPDINAGTAYWFSQAGTVNGQALNPSPAGTFIWAYTKSAAETQGYTITDGDMQAASNKIANAVFSQLASNNYVFTDDPTQANNFSPQNIVAADGGQGIAYLQSLYPNVDYADWGGTLFSQTVLRCGTPYPRRGWPCAGHP